MFKIYRRKVFQIIVLLIAIWLSCLWLILADYQKSIPYAAVSDITTSLKNGNYDSIVKKINNLPEEWKNAKDYKQYVQDNTNSKDAIYYVENKSEQENQKLYTIKIGKTKIMEIAMEKKKEKSLFNFQKYEMKSCNANALVSYTVNNYSKDQVLINNEQLPEKYFIGERDASSNGVNIPYLYKTYKIEDMLSIKDIKLANNPSVVDFNHEKNIINVYDKVDDNRQNEIKEFVKTVIKPYLIFSTATQGSRANILKYVYPNSNLYSSINKYSNTYGMTYVRDELKDLTIDNIVSYTTTEYSCEVSVDYIITQSDGVEKKYEFRKRFYITNRNKSYQLVDMVNK